MPKKLINIARGLTTLLLGGAIILFFFKNYESLILLKDVKLSYCILILPFILTTHLIASANLYILLKNKYNKLPWNKWIKYHLIKRFLNMHIPQSGNVYEAVKMKEKFGIDLLGYVSSFGAVNLFTACLNCILSLLIAIFLSLGTEQWDNKIFITLFLFVIFFAATPFMLDYIFLHAGKIPFPKSFKPFIEKAHKLARAIRNDILDVRVFPKLIFLNILFFIVGVVIFYLSFKALNIKVELLIIVIFNMLSIISGLINIVPGNIGIIEFSYGFLGSAANLTMAAGIILSLLLRLLTYLVFAIIYLFTYIKQR